MPTLRDNATAVPKGPREFDPEITDMAKYIHSYNVDSELAVSPCIFRCPVSPNLVC